MNSNNTQVLQKYAKPIFVSSVYTDVNIPFSFKNWFDSHQGIIPDQEFQQYNEYLVEWYKNKSTQITDEKILLKLNYLALLKQLQIFFSKEESENWYNQIDLNNEKELLLSIPFFARKLKEISLYYLQLRKDIKEVRLKYNQVGTNTGIIRELQKIILNNYTNKTKSVINLPSKLWNNVPELSNVVSDFMVEIEELYDFHNYFDQSPYLPVSAYYNVDDLELKNFLATKNLDIASTEWIYKLGNFELSGNEFNDLLQNLSQKYIGENKFTTTNSSFSAKKDLYEIFIENGNNSFYWPGTVYETKALTFPRYEEISINDLGLETLGTAGSSIELSDTFFIKDSNGIKGAWLRNHLYDFSKENMEVSLEPFKTTIFKFPYPGFGLSSDNSPWTGFSIKEDKKYLFLDDNIKRAIEKEYWSSFSEVSSVIPTKINNTTLIKNKAYAHRNIVHSDKIRIYEFSPNYEETNYSGSIKEAWLYRFDKTDIPIRASNNTVVFWPYEAINLDLEYPSYYPEELTEICEPVAINSINLPFATAGKTLSESDVIYKINNYQQSIEDATECCWLSGNYIEDYANNIAYVQQPSLQLNLIAGSYTHFLWNGPDFADVNSIFKSIPHQKNCKFVTNKYSSYLDHSQCTCRQVQFTPFGHSGNLYNENNSLADFIIEDNFSPNKFDLEFWKDEFNRNYNRSDNFAWFKRSSGIGWGDGTWISGLSSNGNKMYLKKGKKYVYYRANVVQLDPDLNSLPSYTFRYNYGIYNENINDKFVWIRAKKNDDGEWISTDEFSNLKLNPGNHLIYSRTPTSSYYLSGSSLQEIDISQNVSGTRWSNYDYLSNNPNKIVVVNFDTSVLTPNRTLQSVSWTLTKPDTTTLNFNGVSFSFIPDQAGVYSISYKATTVSTGIPTITTTIVNYSSASLTGNIPPITVIPPQTLVPSLTAYSSPNPGYVLNIPLKGWDYSKGIYNKNGRPENQGAKPFWAKTYIEKDKFTQYKGIESSGQSLRFFDDNVISQPEFSDVVLTLGSKIEYTRNYANKINWIQPLNFEILVNENNWCTLEFNISANSNLSDILNHYKEELVTTPTTNISDIKIQNIVDNKPVQIFYNALNSFIFTVTATPQISEILYQNTTETKAISSLFPWNNLSNFNYPTVAAFPTTQDLYSSREIGEYFSPQHLGTSIYINQDYTVSLNLSSDNLKNYFEDINQRYNVRGNTKENQKTPYDLILENNVWLKEPVNSGSMSGTNKKDIFKKYQKFIPYQSASETNKRKKVGLVNPDSLQSPWGGLKDEEWIDNANIPLSFTGELKTSKWADSQILKQNELRVENWASDIFGNQYGLYKDTRNQSYGARKNSDGEIWVRKNSQFVSPGYVALKDVFDAYINTTVFKELTGGHIKKIDLFFDTLMIQTSGSILFEKINYDYNNDNIFSLIDEARHISLAIPVSSNFDREFNNINLSNFNFANAGETWFFPSEKIVIISTCGLENFTITPELYRLDLNKLFLEKIFPQKISDIDLIKSLSAQNIINIAYPLLTYDRTLNEYMFTIQTLNSEEKDVVLQLNIKNNNILTLKNITVYSPTNRETEPPSIQHPLSITIPSTEFLNFQCRIENGGGIFSLKDGPSWITLSRNGLFSGTPPPDKTSYNVLFEVSNTFGPIYYSLNITII